jgi:hypothetical protein
MKRFCLLLLFLVVTSSAWPGQGEGFIGGAADAATDMLNRSMDEDRAKSLMLRQHELEMERIRFEYKLKAESQEHERLQRSAQKQAAQTKAYPSIDLAHPMWRATVIDLKFRTWLSTQPASIQELAKSNRETDAILLLDIYGANAH